MTIKLREDQKVIVRSAKSIVAIMQPILIRENFIDRQKEHGWVAALSDKYQLLNIELVSLGNSNLVHLEPSDIFSVPLQKKSSNIMIIHNHPGGTLRPSPRDKDFTQYIMTVGELVKIKVLDHIIITETGYYSFEETGLMDILDDGVTIQQKAIDNAENRYKITLRTLKEQNERLKKQLRDAAKGVKPTPKTKTARPAKNSK